MDQIIITPEGLEKLKKELAERLERRKVIAEKINYAKNLGDLSENFEYQEAKEDQSFNETRVMELEDMIHRAVVSTQQQSGIINIGSTIEASLEGAKKNFQIVSFNEADPANGKVSNESPLGQAFLGKKVGDEVTVTTPKGTVVYKIVTVS